MINIAAALAVLPFVFAANVNVQRNNEPGFVTAQGTQFFADGQPFPFTATNAYWLHQLCDEDIDATFASIAASGLKVVTTFAYDDVVDCAPPGGGTYFQLFEGDKITINEPGLQRLDSVVRLAEKHGVKLSMSLTGNWYPSTKDIKDPKPHGFLSNSYGGADVYVEQLSTSGFHDAFYTDPKIISAFKNYVQTVVSRYANSTAIFSWQIMDDPKCASTLPASPSCCAQTLVDWHDDIFNFIKSIDCNHLVGTGDTWFYYASEPVYPSKRGENGLDARVDKETLAGLAKRGGASLRATYEKMFKKSSLSTRATPTMNWGGSQLVSQPGSGGMAWGRLDPTQELIDSGNTYIDQQGANGATWGIPMVLTGFGVVTKSNVAFFTPRDSSEVVVPPPGSFVPTDEEQGLIYTAWLNETRCKEFGGVVQYQWVQSCLDASGTNPIIVNGLSPNDGYSATPTAISAIELNAQLQG